MDVNFLIGVVGCVVAVATFFIGRQSASKNEGKAAGSLETDLKYIKESVDRIETRLGADVKELETRHISDVDRLNGRIDEISTQLSTVGSEAARALEVAKSAHARQNEHLKREHGQTVVKGDP